MVALSEWGKQYQEIRPKFERLTFKLKSLLAELLEIEGIDAIIECRTKGVESFEEKISRQDKMYLNPLDEISDLSGIRLILRSLKDVDRASNLILHTFRVDEERSINKLDELEPDRFGYLSKHFIIKVGDGRKYLPEWADISELSAEIQVRTVLQHAWAIISHSLDYKNRLDIPKELRRQLYQLSALFELADERVDTLIDQVQIKVEQYKTDISSKDYSIELNADSLRAYIATSESVEQWVENLGYLGISFTDYAVDVERVLEMARKAGIKSLEELDNLIKGSMGWGERIFQEWFKDSPAMQGPGTIPAIRDNIITTLLVVNYPNVFTDNVLEQEFGWVEPQNLTTLAKKYGQDG